MATLHSAPSTQAVKWNVFIDEWAPGSLAFAQELETASESIKSLGGGVYEVVISEKDLLPITNEHGVALLKLEEM